MAYTTVKEMQAYIDKIVDEAYDEEEFGMVLDMIMNTAQLHRHKMRKKDLEAGIIKSQNDLTILEK